MLLCCLYLYLYRHIARQQVNDEVVSEKNHARRVLVESWSSLRTNIVYQEKLTEIGNVVEEDEEILI